MFFFLLGVWFDIGLFEEVQSSVFWHGLQTGTISSFVWGLNTPDCHIRSNSFFHS